MNYTINVTADDIAKGCRVSTCNCPIARAFLRDYGKCGYNVNNMSVTECDLKLGYYDTLKTRTILTLPESARAFIAKFDNGEPVEPFSFTI